MDNLGFEKDGAANETEIENSVDQVTATSQHTNSATAEKDLSVDDCSVDFGGAIPKKKEITEVRKREPRMIHCRDGVISEDEIGKLYEQFDEPLSKVRTL